MDEQNMEPTLQFYIDNFKFRSPYKILLDSSFINDAIFKKKLQLKDELSKYFQSSVTLFATKCSIEELKKWTNEEKSRGRILPAVNELDVHNCRHKKYLSGEKCLEDLLKTHRLFRCVIATNDKCLQETVLQTSQLPLLQLNKRDLHLVPQPTTENPIQRLKKVEKIEEQVPSKTTPLKEVQIQVPKLQSPVVTLKMEKASPSPILQLRKSIEKKSPMKKMKFRHPALGNRVIRSQKRYSQNSACFFSPSHIEMIGEILRDKSRESF